MAASSSMVPSVEGRHRQTIKVPKRLTLSHQIHHLLLLAIIPRHQRAANHQRARPRAANRTSHQTIKSTLILAVLRILPMNRQNSSQMIVA